MDFRVLGPVEVVDGGRRLAMRGRRHLEVLALLLLEPGHSVSLDRMVTEIWGDEADAGAIASLYTHVSNLRGVLGKERLVRDPAGYRLVLREGDRVDSESFRSTSAEARRLVGAEPASAAATFGAALSLWRGRPFQDLEDLPALEAEIASLEELRAAVQLERFEAILRSGDPPPIDEFEELCRSRPYDERAWGLLMQALYRSGRQADALSTYRRARDLLARELGIEPSPWLVRLEERILLHDPALDPQPTGLPTNLPTYLTAFVGRNRERADLADAIASHRLVSLTGPGGVGKTRLAVEAASQLRGAYPDGVLLIDLGRVADGAGVRAAMAAGVHAAGGAATSVAAAAATLSGRRCLVILDNCEHVLAAAREAAETLVAAAPDLALVATSRVPLGVAGEHRLRLTGLPTSGEGDTPADAISLFLDRVRSIRPGPDGMGDDAGADAAAVAAICRRLDGIPLALELAAARCAVLSPREVADLLTRRFSVLVDASREREIHRSLAASVGWSYGLLEPELRVAFAALGVFEGSFTADAAGAALGLGGPDEAIATLEQLVRASLVEVEPLPGGPTRFRLLATLRIYARERLSESNAWTTVAQRHDRYYVERCRALADTLLVRGRPDALDEIDGASHDLVAAWDRLLPSDAAAVLPIAWALGNYWMVRGGIAEGEERIRDLLTRTINDRSGWRMFVLDVGAGLADRRGISDAALAWSDEAITLAEATGDPLTVVVALNYGGQLRVDRGEQRAAIRMLRRSLDELAASERERGPLPDIADGRAWARLSLAEARRWSGKADARIRDELYELRRYFVEIADPEGQVRADRVLVTMRDLPAAERQRLGVEVMDLARSEADGQLRFEAARAMATVNWDAGDRDAAISMTRAAARAAMARGSILDLGSALLHAGVFAGLTGHAERAARLIGAGQRMCGTRPGPCQPLDLDSCVDRARSELGSERFDTAYRIGTAMAPGEAASLVLSPAQD